MIWNDTSNCNRIWNYHYRVSRPRYHEQNEIRAVYERNGIVYIAHSNVGFFLQTFLSYMLFFMEATVWVVKVYLKGPELYDYKIVFVGEDIIDSFESVLYKSDYKRLISLNLHPDHVKQIDDFELRFDDSSLKLGVYDIKEIENKPYEYYIKDKESLLEVLWIQDACLNEWFDEAHSDVGFFMEQ